jgi:hypothetical protein
VSEDIPGEAIPPLSNRHRYRWQRAENEMFIVYLGRATLKGGWVLVTDQQGRVLQERPVGFFKRLLGKWT